MNKRYSAHRINKRGAGDNTIVYVVLIGVVLVLALGGLLQKNYGLFSITGNEVLSRTMPINVTAGQIFEVTYTVSGASGDWGVILEDNITDGNCSFAGGTNLRTVMLSGSGTSLVVPITTPAGVGTCTFLGDYQFGNKDTKSLGMQTINIISGGNLAGMNNNPPANNDQTTGGNTGNPGFFGNTLFSLGTFQVTGVVFVAFLIVIVLLIMAGRKR